MLSTINLMSISKYQNLSTILYLLFQVLSKA